MRSAGTLLVATLALPLGLAACSEPAAPRPEHAGLSRALGPDELSLRREIVVLDIGRRHARSFLREGWSPADESWGAHHWPRFAWGMGEGSTISMVLDRYLEPRLRLRARPVVHVPERPLEIEVIVNERSVGRVALSAGFDDHEVQLPDDILVPGENQLAFRYHHVPGPETHPLDPRPLAVAWDRIELTVGPRPWESPARFADGALEIPPGSAAHFFVPVPPRARLVADELRAVGPSRWSTPPLALSLEAELDEVPRRAIQQTRRAREREPLVVELGNALGGWVELTLTARTSDDAAEGDVPPEAFFRIEGLRIEAPSPEEAARATDPPCDPCGVILVSLDTLRADHLGAYGYGPPTTPRLDAFRADAILFEEAIAHAPNTLNSHASLLTGLLPSQHKASHEQRRALPDEAVTLAERLSARGWRTAAFTAGGQVDPEFGLAQGFDRYDAESGERVHRSTLRDVVRAGVEWLDDEADAPFFLFLHSYEVHHPYTPRPELLERFDAGYDGPLPDEISVELLRDINRGDVAVEQRDVEHVIATYDAELANADAAFGELVDALRERGRYDDTVIVFTSDHGEEFGEHGRIGWHASSLFREQMRVPLLVKLPGGRLAGAHHDGLARGIDVVPTVLDALGLEIEPPMTGRSLIERIGLDEPLPVLGVSQWDPRGDDARAGWSIRTRRWKMWRGRLSDLAVDPFEQSDVAAQHPAITERLRAELRAVEEAPTLGAGASVTMSDDLEEQLRALGYLE